MTSMEAIQLIEGATSASQLFTGKTYRELAKLCHPDVLDDKTLLGRAQAAFVKLTELHEAADAKPISEVITVGKWGIQSPLAKGDICDLYRVSNAKDLAVLKVARDADDNGLLDRERRALGILSGASGTFSRYLPLLLEGLDLGDRRANILSFADGCYTLREMRSFWPLGIDFRHVVWMGNRLWNLLGHAHREGVLHGSIHPDHLLYRPSDHGLIVVDWCCSVVSGSGDSIPLVSSAWESHYPSEVRKRQPSMETDIYMAAKAMIYAVGGHVPHRFEKLLDWCTADSPRSRPTDSWGVQDQWKSQAEQTYGPATFVTMEVPKH